MPWLLLLLLLLRGLACIRIVGVIHGLLGHLLNRRSLQGIAVLWIVKVLFENGLVETNQSVSVQEVRGCKEVNSFRLQSLEHLFLLVRKEFVKGDVVRVGVVIAQAICLGQLLLEGALLGLRGWVGNNALGAEEIHQLSRHLSEGFLGQQHWVCREFAEGHELHNVCTHVAPESLGVQRSLVGVKHFHG